ncbi:OLC1v1011669C1 [Oldenlandia corymbosa var. corymbosa]|uniref:OLC1v1011669C1 n=1 Tax=Oldenlandia corymbosa var. corymbosa TaxID=529605 RepID=A0AAV1DU93_OLDCO|nr:OLC1v1011669C1 [Oldenlandia corymbosa var. corymbosa]
MGTVYEELDEAKAEIEKLREDYRAKLQLSESLKRAHNEQLSKFQDANLKIEKLSEELVEKAEEICVAKQMYEELKVTLKDKEAAIKHLTSACDKLRTDCKEKLQTFEEESKGLALALDEANAKNLDQEQQIRLLKEEVEGLRGIVSASRVKDSAGGGKTRASQELKRREVDVMLKLEEDKTKYENQLKWKKEQFAHLEEAHQKLKHQFQVSEKEWEREKASLFDEISRLQTNLESQTRISESLQNRLQLCNQALAHEETKRKRVEIELSELKTHFDNVFVEYEEAKSTVESLTDQRDKDIASLRNTLCTKESLYKEMEYQARVLKQENQELMASLKELQEAQIQEGGGSFSSLTKLRNKLKGLEQVHRDCSARLKSKEAEWNSELDVLREKLKCCCSELDSKSALVDQLKMEAEAHDCLIMQQASQKEESAVMILVLKSVCLEAKMKLDDVYADLDKKNKELEKCLSQLRYLQKVHKGCSDRLKLKEAEWKDELESWVEKLKNCMSELESKKMIIDQQQMEAKGHNSLVENLSSRDEETCDSLLDQLALRDEEAALILLVLKLEFTEAHKKLAVMCADLEEKNKVTDERISQLLTQLEMKNTALVKAQLDAEEERQKFSQLALKAESVNFVEEQQVMQHQEIDKLERMLRKSHESQSELKQQLIRVKFELKEVQKALNVADEELEEQICRRIESEFGVHLWRSAVEQLKMNLQENHRVVEVSLQAELRSLKSDLKKARRTLAKANEELDERFCEVNKADFELQLWKSIAEHLKVALEENHQMRRQVEASLLAEVALEVNLNQEKEGLLNQLEEKNNIINGLHEQIIQLNQELDSHDKESLHHLVEEREQRIENLQQLVKSLEQEFESSTTSFSSRLSGMQSEMNIFREAWQKITTSVFLKEVTIEEKNLIIQELENELLDLKELLRQAKTSDIVIQKLRDENSKMAEDVTKLSSERDCLLDTLNRLSDRMNKLSMDDVQLMESLRSIVQTFDSNEFRTTDALKENSNSNLYSSPKGKKKAEAAIIDERLPFRALNS